jgi:AraC-like DNA-binding protein
MNNKVVVVEDELIIALDIKQILDNNGFEAIIDITSVEEAVICIEKHEPILVLIDINLNKKRDGIDLGNYLLQKDNIPYLYITSFSDKMTLDRVIETRPHGFIVKPFKPVDLISNVAIVLNNYKHKNIDPLRLNNQSDDWIPYRLRQITNYINENIDKKIEIDELVQLTQWKRHHFTRLFTKYLRVSPYQYILLRKIDKAKLLLEETVIPINEIANDLGFKSYSNFCNAFKKIKSDTPEHHRRKYRKEK